MLLALALATLFAAVALAGEALTLPARERRAALRRALAPSGAAAGPAEEGPGFRERVIVPLRPALARLALRLSRGATAESVRLKLLAAGLRDTAPTTYLALRGGLGLLGVVVGLLFGAGSGLLAGIVFGAALGSLGFVGPEFALSSRARRRREHIDEALPDALDLLAVSVEAGLSFDGSVAKLTERVEGPLVEELSLALGEMRIGRGRHDALRAMVERVDSPELAAFTRSVIQAEQLGLALSRALRVQADESRRRRQTAAEEKAMKAPVKMLFPTVIFIFPALFLLILGPALLNLMEAL